MSVSIHTVPSSGYLFSGSQLTEFNYPGANNGTLLTSINDRGVATGIAWHDQPPLGFVATPVPRHHSPDCSSAAAAVTRLWPPDHRLIPISIIGVTDPDGDPISIRITGVTQDEPAGSR